MAPALFYDLFGIYYSPVRSKVCRQDCTNLLAQISMKKCHTKFLSGQSISSPQKLDKTSRTYQKEHIIIRANILSTIKELGHKIAIIIKQPNEVLNKIGMKNSGLPSQLSK